MADLAPSASEMISSDQIAANREAVQGSFDAARKENHRLFVKKDVKATEEYIFPNQMEDAMNIANIFYEKGRRVVSVQKKTKVGADGLMIAIAYLLATHSNDRFVVNPDNIRIITGMSNASWEADMIKKAPSIFKDKIFHHGKLPRAILSSLRNGLLIIDEVDSGDKEGQVLHNTLKEAGVLNIGHLEEFNVRIVLISATMIKELYELYRWGDLHESYKMTIPPSYIGHIDFVRMGIIQEFYPLTSRERAEKWVQEDILDYYGTDNRVHIVRVNGKGVTPTANIIQNACVGKGVVFRNHTSMDRLTADEEREFFKEPLTKHVVLAVKGFYRRANLIPNEWKLRIGATHELYTHAVDYNVQVQGLPGRMTGYWRSVVEGGHKTGPHRTSIKAIEAYEEIYHNPFSASVVYHSAGFIKRRGGVSIEPTLYSQKNVAGLEARDLPDTIASHPVRSPASRPVAVLSLNAEQDARAQELNGTKRHNKMWQLLKELRPGICTQYPGYELSWWRVGTAEEFSKWCIAAMLAEDAISTTANIHKHKKGVNYLRVYYYEGRLILQPWAGATLAAAPAAAGAVIDDGRAAGGAGAS
jgi:hypothetical protein